MGYTPSPANKVLAAAARAKLPLRQRLGAREKTGVQRKSEGGEWRAYKGVEKGE